MSGKPILFSGPMVRALLNGSKTQTRRANHLERLRRFGPITEFGRSDTKGYDWHFRDKAMRWNDLRHADLLKYLPWQTGDRLYVRESWNWTFIKDLAPGESLGRTLDDCCEANGGFACPVGDGIVYAATNAHEHPEFGKARWKPSLLMPRYASRLTLTVTDVRVERLQEISAADAIDEGFQDRSTRAFLPAAYGLPDWPADWCGVPRDAYRRLWEQINGEGSWAENPWVAAYTFTVERGNIDQPRAV
jgi:hypothetical protein